MSNGAGHSACVAWALVGIALLAASATTIAQPDTGSLVQHYDRAVVPPGEGNLLSAQRVLYQYANCLAKAERPVVEHYLATRPGSVTAVNTARKIATSECLMDGDLSISVEAMRGPMYQALYRLDFRSQEPADPAKAPPLVYGEHPVQQIAISDPVVGVRMFADCAVRANPAAARNLVLSEIASIEERDALQQMMPAMSACITPGAKLGLTRRLIRATVAEVLYRLTMASSGHPAFADRK